ncbi:MAG: leucyl/phenylalanyl-tRNA--protein transferase [SAR116 cluster bacterium]|nr:leucyl/phenylalanyl-tRNA--protein transferase [SAR116 cluster bacterium]
MEKITNHILKGYYQGNFPMSNSRDDDDIFFVNPNFRAIIPIDRAHVSRSLNKALLKKDYRITSDKLFSEIIDSCGSPVFGRAETWINRTIIKVFNELHKNGFAHSIEIWREASLVGGIYGISIGGVFFAESMFSSVTNASKIGLIFLLSKLHDAKFKLFDIQFLTPHLASMGGIQISRDNYLEQLNKSIYLEYKFPQIDTSNDADWAVLKNYLHEIKNIS